MTEESDDADDPNHIVFHKLEWRSESKDLYVYIVTIEISLRIIALNKYIKILDTRLSKIAARDVAGNVAKKVRSLGESSLSSPPVDAPSWAVTRVLSQEREGMN